MARSDQVEPFWVQLDKLVKSSQIVVDRPRGSRHPRYAEVVYTYDYGYLRGTRAGDGDGIDVWLGSAATQEITGIVCTVDTDQRDAEIKILLGCTQDEMLKIAAFHNQGNQAAYLIPRPTESTRGNATLIMS